MTRFQIAFIRWSVPTVVFLLLEVSSLVAVAESIHWNQFRGPNGAGTAAGFKPPLNILAQQAVWITPLPPGKSSPVLWGERIYVTGVGSNRLTTVALDANSGLCRQVRSWPDDPADDTVLVVGITTNSSSYGDFYPTTSGAYATCSNTLSGGDAFVSKLSADLSTLVASTCIGQYSAVELALPS